jgi:signal transduction histidine kinase
MAFRDRGTGIAAHLLDKVVEPFFTTKPRGEGTGLGLSISHGIVSDHGGRLSIESVEGEFTKVVIDLPARESGHGENPRHR